METNELFCLTQRILVNALNWRKRQDKLIKTIHYHALSMLHDGWEPPLTEQLLERLKSGLPEGYSTAEIKSAVESFLDSEFGELSAVFSGLYTEFNYCYFAGALPTYRVKVIHAASNERLRSNLAHSDDHRQEIVIAYDGRPEEMISLLMDTMAYTASTLETEPNWDSELDRLYSLGAPTRRRVEDYDDVVDWADEGSSCCSREDQLECRWKTQANEAWADAPGNPREGTVM